MVRVQHHQFALAKAAVIPAREQAKMFPRRRACRRGPVCIPAKSIHQVVELAVQRLWVGDVFVERKRRRAANFAADNSEEDHSFCLRTLQYHDGVEVAKVSYQV